MDDETLGVLDKYFGLIHKRFDSMQVQLNSLEARLTSVEGRLTKLESGMANLRTEMNERFISIEDQFRTLSLTTAQFQVRWEGTLGTLTEQGWQLNTRMKNVEAGIGHLNGRVDQLADEMRQRFRAW